jgi:hypothetical protein
LDRVQQAYFTPKGQERFKSVVDKHVVAPCKKVCIDKCQAAADKAKCGAKCGTRCWAKKYPQIFKTDLIKVLP